jgi:50S ribosomal protein L16 3-hydroxylase
MTATNGDALLGGISQRTFLARYWQRRALFIADAIRDFVGPFNRRDILALALRDDVESRLVVRDGSRYSLAHGPFRRVDFRALPKRRWTLLVQGTNLVNAEADRLLRRFDFLPRARQDDVMVSYAAPGGGVGPHFDSYDVFLLQGFGRRRWRYGRQRDLSLVPGLPLKILERFEPTHERTLSPGDMLYLPPAHAHDGVAIDECTTYSIGFRAPSNAELAGAFLDFLHDAVDLQGRYRDPGIAPARHAARIPEAMVHHASKTLARIRWSSHDIGRFLGSYLSEPKSHVRFEAPHMPLTAARFAARTTRTGVRLDLRSQLLYDDARVYMNGEALAPRAGDFAIFAHLADERALSSDECARLSRTARKLLYDWYRYGYVIPAT